MKIAFFYAIECNLNPDEPNIIGQKTIFNKVEQQLYPNFFFFALYDISLIFFFASRLLKIEVQNLLKNKWKKYGE